ncbi:MAG: AAA family ATPase [Acidimicrobiales bacterium]
MERSPFPHQGPLAPEQVSGRDDLVADLAERLTERRLTALLGPRRYGKTSLLKRVTADLAAVGPSTVWIDLYELSSVADLAGAVDRGLSKVTGAARRILDSIAGTVSIRLGVVGIELSKGRRDRPDPVLTLRALLDVLVRTAQRQDLIVVFDEFSGIANVEGAAGLLRTELQHHYQELAIVFAGSQPSTMRTLFSDQAQPFFAQADLVEIGPLADDAVADVVEDGFECTRRGTGSVTSRLVAFAAGHPQRAMQLADALWRLTDEGGTADDLAWEEAVATVRANVDNGSERLYALLPSGHQRSLRVVASGGSVYGTAADVLGLSPGTARAALEALVGNGYLERRGGRSFVVDPLFADWIRRRFPI